MSDFTEKEVLRAIRDFESSVQDIINASNTTYQSRIKSIISIINNNLIINSIVEPLLNLDVDLDSIHNSNNGHWINRLDLPVDKNKQIAYVLKVFILESENKLSLANLAHRIYKDPIINKNIERYLSEVVKPCLRELTHRLNDLVEDKVEGKNTIPNAALQILNYGQIHAEGGSTVAIGKDIQQTVTYKNIVNEIMDRIREEQIIPEDTHEEINNISKEIESEINSPNPSQTKLKGFAQRLYEIGQNGVLKITNKVIGDPRWGQAVADTIIDMV